ncbi:MAG: hypothetical protein NTU47_06135 [Ignavibacteriales bacterium]|nr:hypothetical protein [Ignavibacteriales bacterium]
MRPGKVSAGYAFVLFFGGFLQSSSAQQSPLQNANRFFDVTAGLGIAVHSTPLLANYINALAQPPLDQRVDQFNSAAEFYVIPELQVSRDWSVGIEYSMLLKSYSIDSRSAYARTEIAYEVHMPSVLLHYLVFGDGFRLKFGGGAGYHFAKFDQSFPLIGAGETFRISGPGFKIDAVGNTKFDDTFYGSIGIDLRWDFLGALSRSAGASQVARSGPDLPKMNFFNAGVKFGVTFQLF